MISEGSCDTEDWSNAENSALPTQEITQENNSSKVRLYNTTLLLSV